MLTGCGTDGVYSIKPRDYDQPINVRCQMASGESWLVCFFLCVLFCFCFLFLFFRGVFYQHFEHNDDIDTVVKSVKQGHKLGYRFEGKAGPIRIEYHTCHLHILKIERQTERDRQRKRQTHKQI